MRLQPHQLRAYSAHIALGGKPEDFVMPAPKPRAKRSYEESETQIALFKWWAAQHRTFGAKRCCMFAIPNGSALGTGKEDWQVKQRVIRGRRLKAEGLTPGVFDIFVAIPRIRTNSAGAGGIAQVTASGFCGLFVEMKRREGEPSADQIEFQEAMEANGYKCVICWSLTEAITEITAYLS